MTGIKHITISILIALFFSSCATIIEGRNTTLFFSKESSPKADVYLDGDKIGEAPGKITVASPKIQHGSVISLKKDGYEDKEYKIVRKQHTIFSMVDFCFLGIPLLVDYTTGNIYQPTPKRFHYELEKKQND